jgi:hypothetical protein
MPIGTRARLLAVTSREFARLAGEQPAPTSSTRTFKAARSRSKLLGAPGTPSAALP